MTSKVDPNLAKRWATLLKKLQSDATSSHNAHHSTHAAPRAPQPILAVAVHATLLWEASSHQAKLAHTRLLEHFADYNDVRVAPPSQVIAILGERYPLATERSARLHCWLYRLFESRHTIDLERLRDVRRQDARSLLADLEGMPYFAASYTASVGLGLHTVAIDERLLHLLMKVKVFEKSVTVQDATAVLEKLIAPDELISVAILLRDWSDHEGQPPKREFAGVLMTQRHADLPTASRSIVPPAITAEAEPRSSRADASETRPRTKRSSSAPPSKSISRSSGTSARSRPRTEEPAATDTNLNIPATEAISDPATRRKQSSRDNFPPAH